jgi:hypothetical protein
VSSESLELVVSCSVPPLAGASTHWLSDHHPGPRVAECVAQAGFQPLHQKRRGIFNQFACESKANASKRLVAISCACRPAQCSESCCGSQEALDDDDTYFSAPATVHPVKHAETIGLLHRQFPRASNEAVHDVGEALRKLLATTNTLLAAEITSAAPFSPKSASRLALLPASRADARNSSNACSSTRIAYIHIPKAGGDSVLAMLQAGRVPTCDRLSKNGKIDSMARRNRLGALHALHRPPSAHPGSSARSPS